MPEELYRLSATGDADSLFAEVSKNAGGNDTRVDVVVYYQYRPRQLHLRAVTLAKQGPLGECALRHR